MPFTAPQDHHHQYITTRSQLTLVSNCRIHIIATIIISWTVPDLPPRIDRASKPSNNTTSSTPASSLPSRNSSTGGTLGRSAQERLFGTKTSTDSLELTADDYATRSQILGASTDKREAVSNGINSLERIQSSSIERTRMSQPPGASSNPNPTSKANGSYDSVSSYDTYNTTQLTAQNMRLGPNAPDDLKSVPK